ncbi:hypothetical protein IMZ48_10195 [Candidatus Bathyarchaeota archaeon]|nr:hypothetical protein [Candidatus Bathyarchaeota archaeon]
MAVGNGGNGWDGNVEECEERTGEPSSLGAWAGGTGQRRWMRRRFGRRNSGEQQRQYSVIHPLPSVRACIRYRPHARVWPAPAVSRPQAAVLALAARPDGPIKQQRRQGVQSLFSGENAR